mmetsp:Transcript_6208/g.12238  ORF Transcript_6208/g.12238 Transcript_6208/m.12238 type:complete len:398 (-) Transcript_6208:1088-2281(-)|eukprot:CAMPEP_0184678028 /NCGR_PEP_ID=MMETSP0312-20130426/655_1 /TAXON_ID=31354 /ORGANISM="Compsopogon coeruleus, Strain SAG 36.94" /LENGTH=397 /DNA_ID=CAMNT_0027126341 /DNA_START=193 /DNA_END=1386 /DNA_ORIENTATION=+
MSPSSAFASPVPVGSIRPVGTTLSTRTPVFCLRRVHATAALKASARAEDENVRPVQIVRGRSPATVVKSASAAPASSDDGKSEMMRTLKVGLYIGLWYAFNIVYNISNKRTLNALPLAWMVSWLQLVVGIIWGAGLWVLRLRKAPKLNDGAIKALTPVAIAHTVGHVGTVASLGAVAVSFTHVVKSLEPFVNVLGSAIVLKSIFPTPVYLSLLPIVAGVIMASVSEVSFTWMGFLSAMSSNFAFTARNIISKINMNTPKGDNMNSTNLFTIIQIISVIILAPFALWMDGAKMKGAWLGATTGASAVTTPQSLFWNLIISGLFFQLYQEVSYKALDSVHPVTHAVANTVKRVVIIVTSIIVFRNPITRFNAMGSTIAILGVLLYSMTKNYYEKKAKSA